MKIASIIPMLFLPIFLYAQETDATIDLQWKIAADEPLAYRTMMETINQDHKGYNVRLFRDFVKGISDSAEIDQDDFEKVLEAVTDINENYNFTTLLTLNNKDIIDVRLISEPKPGKKKRSGDEFDELFNESMKGVQMRGKINRDGGIESFYVKRNQLNLLALMFELPTYPVSIGDRWSINVNLISNDHNFICDDYNHRNRVELVKTASRGNDLIAYLKYDLWFYVKGSFINPFSQENIPTTMDLSFEGISEFNVSQGRWDRYQGIMKSHVSGMMNSDTEQLIKLEQITKVPGSILQYE